MTGGSSMRGINIHFIIDIYIGPKEEKLLNLSPPLPPARIKHKMGSIKYKQMCRQVLGLPELKPKTANDYLEDKLRSDKLTKHLPRVIRLYLLRHTKFVDNNIKK